MNKWPMLEGFNANTEEEECGLADYVGSEQEKNKQFFKKTSPRNHDFYNLGMKISAKMDVDVIRYQQNLRLRGLG